MALITITVPDGLVAELVAVLRAELGEQAVGRRDLALWGLYLQRQLEGPLKASRRRSQVAAAVATEQSAREVAEQASARERAARVIAEGLADASAKTDIERIS